MSEANKSGKSSGRPNRNNGRRRYFRAKESNAPANEEPSEPGKSGRVGGQRTSARRSSAQKSNQRPSSQQGGNGQRSEAQPSETPRADLPRHTPARGDAARSESPRSESPQSAESSRSDPPRSRSRRSNSARASTARSSPERATGDRSGRGGGQHTSSGSRQRVADMEARRVRRRRRRANQRTDVVETKPESPVTVSTLDYTAPTSVSIYTYVTRGDFGERYESKVEHFSSIGRRVEDYGIDLSKLIAEDGTIHLPQMNTKITDWESDEPVVQ